MKLPVILRRFIVGLFVVLNLLTLTPGQATADTFDDMIWLLQKVEKVSGPVFPISIQDIKESKGYINCLVNADSDLDVAVCTDTFHDTKLGQQAASEAGIPSWFWNLMDLYIDLRTGDIWGAVEHLGKAALCLVAQILAEGYDVCGLIQELAELGDTLLDAGAAVGEFLADAGEALADAASAVGCAIGLGGCDKPTPPEVRVYQWVFAPRVADAIVARTMVNPNAYTSLFTQLKENARHDPAIYSVPSKTVTMGPVSMVVPPVTTFSVAAVNIAAGAFDTAVEANWSSYVVSTALGELSSQRNGYNNPNQLRFLVNNATADFEALQRSNPGLRIDQKLPELIVDRCTKEFSEARKFAHVDRWIVSHQAQSMQLGNPKTNRDWCSQLWEQNKQAFIQPLRRYAADAYCHENGSTLGCNSLNSYQSCTRLMGLAQQQGICSPTNYVGREAAAIISNDLQRRGSRIPCSIRNDSKGISPATVDLVCSRPSQGAACTATYQNLFVGLPVRLVNCVVEERPDYAALKTGLNATVKTLQMSKRFAINLDQVDPLVAHVDASKEELLMALQQPGADPGASRGEAARIAQSLRYEYQYNATIDGENSPLYLRARGGANQVTAQQSGNAQQGTHIPISGSHAATQADGSAFGPGFNRYGGFSDPANQSMQQQHADYGNTANRAAQHGGVASQQAQARAMTPPVSGKPDLLVLPQLSIANSPARWGSTVVLYTHQVQSAGNGLCSADITYTVQNSGTAAATEFASVLLNRATTSRPLPHQWAGIAQGITQSRTERLILRPGRNDLTLHLDQSGQLVEMNRGNNQARLLIILNGSCQP